MLPFQHKVNRRNSDSLWQSKTGPLGRSPGSFQGQSRRTWYSIFRLLLLLFVLLEILRLGGFFTWPWESNQPQNDLDQSSFSIPSTPILPSHHSPAPVAPLQQLTDDVDDDNNGVGHTYKKPVEPYEVPAPLGPAVYGDPVWPSFKFLTRFFGGLRAVSTRSTGSEYPHDNANPQATINPVLWTEQDKTEPPVPKLDDPYSDQTSSASGKLPPIQACFLDKKETIPVPRAYSYPGGVQGFPDPIIGSYEALGLDGKKCYDRYGRFGPYGYGYSTKWGGVGAGIDGLRELVHQSRYTDYNRVNWGDVSKSCLEKNKNRFQVPSYTNEKWRAFDAITHNKENPSNEQPSASSKGKLQRTAVMIRIWHGLEWRPETIIHMRAMIAELSLLSGGEYQVYFLIHVKDNTIPIWSSDEIYEKILRESLPEEFWGLGVLWSEKQMELFYYGLDEWKVMERSVYSVYRSAHFPLQYFAYSHPEYEYLWNWEMDIRSTGNWYEVFDSLRSFAQKQPRKGLWERNERFYIPSVHGTWDQFIKKVEEMIASEDQDEPPVWGRNAVPETPTFPDEPVPPRSYEQDQYEWGVGEEADLITLNPLFNPVDSGWVFTEDVVGYHVRPLPRRIAIITASRLSRRLLTMMHRETSQYRHTMFDEMWPASVALHHGLKAVYAPHPVYIERAWPPEQVDETFNSGPNGVAGSSNESPFNMLNEHNFRGVTWYYHAALPGKLWRRWWGYSVTADTGIQGGGFDEEVNGEGRMCLPPMLMHPVKDFELGSN